MSKQRQGAYEFGAYRLEVAERRLLRERKAVPLAPKVFETLLTFVENSGRLITKDELLSRLWPDTFVEEATLAIINLGLGDDEAALKWLCRACEEHAGWMIYLTVDTRLDPLRAQQQFGELLRRVGLRSS